MIPQKDIVYIQKAKLSFEIIYNEYYEKIFRFVYHRVGDMHQAKDLTSEIFIKVFSSIKKYKPNGSFNGWIYRIASNYLTDFFRKKQVNQYVYLAESHYQLLSDELSIQISVEIETVINNLFETLPEEEVEILRMKFFEGLSFKDMSVILQIKESACKMKFYRLLDKIKGSPEIIAYQKTL